MIRKTLFSVLLITLITISLLLLSTCKKDPLSSTVQEDTYTTIVSEPIDENGGEIVADELTFTVPPSAFNSTTEIRILSSTDDKPFDENHTSKSYKIEGIPLDYTKPLKISIKYDGGSSTGNKLLAIGEESVVHGESTISYTFLSSADSVGFISGEIPVPEQGVGKTQLYKPGMGADAVFATLVGYNNHETAERHFLIRYPWGEDAGAQELGIYLEEAYQKVLDLGFNYDERTNWNEVPVGIILRKLKTGTDGLTSCSWFGNNHGYIEFNTDLLSDYSKLRITAGHEFFHLIQFLYDSRSGIEKSSFSSTHHWVNEVTAAWFEEKFTNITNYVPEVVEGWEPTSLDGMQLSPYDNNGVLVENFMPKCYGRTPIIKYLVERYDKNIIVKMFDDIKIGIHPVDAVCQTDPDGWWVDFLKEFILGNVYPNSAEEWIASSVRSGDFQINSNTDVLKTFTNQYRDLSGRLYFIRFNNNNLDSKSQIKFAITGAEKKYLTIFRFNNSSNPKTLEYLASNPNKVIIKNISNYNSNGQHLLALVSNNRYTPPYTWDNEINLEVKIEQEVPQPDFNRCGVQVDFGGRYSYTTPDDAYDRENERYTLSTWLPYPGSFSGNTFTASYDRNTPTSPLYGNINATFNEDYSIITNINWTEYRGDNSTRTFIGTDIALDTNEWGTIYQVKTEETYNHITSLTDVQNVSDGLSWTLSDYWCNGDSKIYISFSKE